MQKVKFCVYLHFTRMKVMRFLLLFPWAMAAVGCSTLHDSRDAFQRHASLSASNYVAYRGPHQLLTPAPEGKHPFYLSHYGRHGSRYLSHPQTYD